MRCPKDNEIIYVGCTEDMYSRFITHCNRNNSNAPIADYIRELRKIGLKPILEIIHTIVKKECTYKEYVALKKIASDTEKYYIVKYCMKPNSRMLNVKHNKNYVKNPIA